MAARECPRRNYPPEGGQRTQLFFRRLPEHQLRSPTLSLLQQRLPYLRELLQRRLVGFREFQVELLKRADDGAGRSPPARTICDRPAPRARAPPLSRCAG